MTIKEDLVPDDVPKQELLIGELTAALAAESMTVQDALPTAIAARAIAAGEVIGPLKANVVSYDAVVVPSPPVAAPVAAPVAPPVAPPVAAPVAAPVASLGAPGVARPCARAVRFWPGAVGLRRRRC